MDLFCCESERPSESYSDPVLDDTRVFENLLLSEERHTISSCYFKCLQTDLNPCMRRVVAEWMQEVCEEEHCMEQVFSLAVNILDRFLSLVYVHKKQLQLLGSVCVFLASKLKHSRPIPAEKLSEYTDYSVSATDIVSWEIMVLTLLKWDIASVTPSDFLGHILRRLPINQGQDIVIRHANTFIGLCGTDVKFSMYPPSMIAAASIGAAIQGLVPKLVDSRQWTNVSELLQRLHQITGIEVDCLRSCLEQIEESLREKVAAAELQISSNNSGAVPLDVIPNPKLMEQQMSPSGQPIVLAETPTDVQDILF